MCLPREIGPACGHAGRVSSRCPERTGAGARSVTAPQVPPQVGEQPPEPDTQHVHPGHPPQAGPQVGAGIVGLPVQCVAQGVPDLQVLQHVQAPGVASAAPVGAVQRTLPDRCCGDATPTTGEVHGIPVARRRASRKERGNVGLTLRMESVTKTRWVVYTTITNVQCPRCSAGKKHTRWLRSRSARLDGTVVSSDTTLPAGNPIQVNDRTVQETGGDAVGPTPRPALRPSRQQLGVRVDDILAEGFPLVPTGPSTGEQRPGLRLSSGTQARASGRPTASFCSPRHWLVLGACRPVHRPGQDGRGPHRGSGPLGHGPFFFYCCARRMHRGKHDRSQHDDSSASDSQSQVSSSESSGFTSVGCL